MFLICLMCFEKDLYHISYIRSYKRPSTYVHLYVVLIVIAINEFIYYCPQYFTTERNIFKYI
jgi:hypothetical protein